MESIVNTLMLGGHVSTSGGIYSSIDRAESFSFRTFQIFSKNQMQWKAKPLIQEDVERFREGVRKNGMSGIMIHASYLLNMGTLDSELRGKVLDAFSEEIKRADQLGIDFLTFHPGSAGKSGNPAESRKMVAENLNSLLEKEQHVRILLETSAGQGQTIGSSFEELAEIIDMIDIRERVGICFDTCHVWASGYDIKSVNGYQETMDRFKSIIGLERLLGFHLNDSKKGQGSRVDRHEQIGQGTLGIDGISNFVKDKRFRNTPMILETPKGEEGYPDDIRALSSINLE
jgi:apurinic endonuclease (APN1)